MNDKDIRRAVCVFSEIVREMWHEDHPIDGKMKEADRKILEKHRGDLETMLLAAEDLAIEFFGNQRRTRDALERIADAQERERDKFENKFDER